MTRPILFGMLAAIAVAAFAVPAGNDQPLIVRVVTIGDRTGPAFYSMIEQGYRFIGSPELFAADQVMAGGFAGTGRAAGSAETSMVTAEVENRPAR
ncbi:hypothetical protein [Jiella avicenniae]|uniref:Uncharacterized protein n=1 Tax=Jiella avicenniae TaxID=2907202 RepID=A0A9X1NY44_9HYPH|nr:hypothetical protein [Jiella avicenniae]MCE7027870.1 hypothetical protein [Jiella avicenniae]